MSDTNVWKRCTSGKASGSAHLSQPIVSTGAPPEARMSFMFSNCFAQPRCGSMGFPKPRAGEVGSTSVVIVFVVPVSTTPSYSGVTDERRFTLRGGEPGGRFNTDDGTDAAERSAVALRFMMVGKKRKKGQD